MQVKTGLLKGSLALGLTAAIGFASASAVLADVNGAGYGYGYGYGTQTNAPASVIRDYNVHSGDHFYTTNAAEATAAQGFSYNNEGTVFTGLSTTQLGASPVYRLYSAANGKHFYTANFGEALAAESSGFKTEGISFYAWASQYDAPGTPNTQTSANTVDAVARAYNPTSGDHLYTKSASEAAAAVGSGAYRTEGTAFYLNFQ